MSVFARCSALLLLLITAWPVGVAEARPTPAGATWELTELTEPVQESFTPSSGAFLARTASGLLRSDDAGASWRALALPPAGPRSALVAVDPTNHDVVYATGAEGLYRSVDGGLSWMARLSYVQVDPTVAPDRFVWHLAVSPAEPNLLYVGVTWVFPTDRGLLLLRSRDGGATWQTVERTRPPSLCGWGLFLLAPHPSDAQRVMASIACVAGRDFGAPIVQSNDQGEHWSQYQRTLTDLPWAPSPALRRCQCTTPALSAATTTAATVQHPPAHTARLAGTARPPADPTRPGADRFQLTEGAASLALTSLRTNSSGTGSSSRNWMVPFEVLNSRSSFAKPSIGTP